VIQCSFCGTGYSVKQKGALKFDRYWKRMDGVQALVDRTNPQFGNIPASDRPSREELFALLESVNERSNPFTLNAGRGWLKGAVVGGIACAILFVLLYELAIGPFPNVFGAAMLGVMLGGFAGSIVTTVQTKFRYARSLAEEILIDSMHRNSISVEMLKRALKHHPKSLRYVTGAIADLEAA
jgi:hypothetical protein